MPSEHHYHEDATEKGEIPPRIKAIMDLGVQVSFDGEWVHGEGAAYGRHPVALLERVSGVKAPFSDSDWAAIAQREGSAYVGGCCGNMSALQDEINGVFRDGGHIDHAEFHRIAQYARGHEGFETWEPVDDEGFQKLIDRWKEGLAYIDEHPEQAVSVDPWFKLGVVFLATEEHLEPPPSMDLPSLETPVEKERPVHHALSTAADALEGMRYFDLFGSDKDDDKLSHEPQRNLNLAKMLPALRDLVAAIEEHGVEFEGFALVAQDTDEIYTDRQGPCIYFNREDAERVLRVWEKYSREEDQMNRNHERASMERIGRLAVRVAEGDADAAKQYEEEKQRALAQKGHRAYDFWSSRRAEIVPVKVTVENGLEVLR